MGIYWFVYQVSADVVLDRMSLGKTSETTLEIRISTWNVLIWNQDAVL